MLPCQWFFLYPELASGPDEDGQIKRAWFTEEQIIAVLREHGAGVKTADLAPKHGISEATLYNWKAPYGGMDVSEAKRLEDVCCQTNQAGLRVPCPRASSGRAELTPLGQPGGMAGLEVLAGQLVSVLIEVVVNGAVQSGEFLKALHASKPQHCSLALSEWQVGILDLVVQPAVNLTLVMGADRLERCAV